MNSYKASRGVRIGKMEWSAEADRRPFLQHDHHPKTPKLPHGRLEFAPRLCEIVS